MLLIQTLVRRRRRLPLRLSDRRLASYRSSSLRKSSRSWRTYFSPGDWFSSCECFMD